MWKNNKNMDKLKTPVYTAPEAEDCSLLQDSLICYSGDNEGYDQQDFQW
jgi:hypothetical protein